VGVVLLGDIHKRNRAIKKVYMAQLTDSRHIKAQSGAFQTPNRIVAKKQQHLRLQWLVDVGRATRIEVR
jgi:hypothetical protein